MTTGWRLAPIETLPDELQALAVEARREGFPFLDRLIAEWQSGANRFQGTGECLLGVWRGGELMAIGGVGRDPYSEGGGRVGRVRHVYVRPCGRRKGVGRLLMRELLAREHGFDRLRLRTPEGNTSAARFYESLGFESTLEANATHIWVLVD